MTEAPVLTPQDAQAEQIPAYEDYWGVKETFKFFLPDGKQFFEIKPMDEGAKSKFQKLTNQDLVVGRDQTATVRMDPAKERHTLILESVVSYHIMQRDNSGEWSEYPCPVGNDTYLKRALEQLLEKFNPKVVQDLEFFIRTKNPWMQADMEIEEIDNEIDRLTKLREQVKEQQAGEAASANK